jgi:uracil-DNA glycosylase
MAKYLKHFHPEWIESWKYLHTKEFEKLVGQLAYLYKNEVTYPIAKNVFRMFRELPPSQIKIVIMGLDPYIKEGEASGIAMGVEDLPYIPSALNNLFDEVERDFGTRPTDYSLMSWVEQGVFLTNTALTVKQFTTGSHAHIWHNFTKEFVTFISNQIPVICFMGKKAQTYVRYTDAMLDEVLVCAHPAVDSYGKGVFYGNGIFSQINNILKKKNGWEIQWY